MLKASSDVTIRTEVNLNSNIAGALPLPTDIRPNPLAGFIYKRIKIILFFDDFLKYFFIL